MVLSESELSHQAASETLPLRDAFAVLFFVSVGMLFDPMILIEEFGPVLATFLIIVIGKSLAAFAIVRLFGHPNSDGADLLRRALRRSANSRSSSPASVSAFSCCRNGGVT
jgi:predicted Kef-type K+ transport protein